MALRVSCTPLSKTMKRLTIGVIAALVSSSAFAEPQSCSTSNLLREWETEKPDVFSKIRIEADAVPNGKNIFWKIEKDGTAPSYLLGTVHVSDPRIVELPETAKAAYSSATNIVLELSEVVDQQQINAEFAKRPELMLAKPGSSIESFIGTDHVEELDIALKARGMSVEATRALNPVLVYTFLAMPACEFLRQSKGASFLDKELGQRALKDGKKLYGLETPTEQLEALASLPEDFVRQSLISAVQLGEKLDALTSTTVELYLKEDIGAIIPLMNAATEQFDAKDEQSDANFAAFEESLITKRNHTMADRAVQYLERGPTLIAVGALHLPGSQGLVELLRAKGYTLSPVPLTR